MAQVDLSKEEIELRLFLMQAAEDWAVNPTIADRLKNIQTKLRDAWEGSGPVV